VLLSSKSSIKQALIDGIIRLGNNFSINTMLMMLSILEFKPDVCRKVAWDGNFKQI